MFGYGLGHDEEVPGGFQDADLEARELEERAEEEDEFLEPDDNYDIARDGFRDDGRSDGHGESYAERNT